MEPKDYWLNAVAMIATAVAPILIAYGVVTQEEADLWVNLVLALAAVIVPIVIGSTVQNWTKQSANVRVAELHAGIR
jgi:hypothetical protein